MQGTGGKAEPARRAQIRDREFQAIQSPGNTGFLLGKGSTFCQGIRHHGQAFGRRITKLNHAFGINAVPLSANGKLRDFLGRAVGGVGDAGRKALQQRGFCCGIGAEYHHGTPAEGEGADG